MPCPIDLYHGPASFLMSMPAAFQRLSSAIWVPERSPREMKGAPLALMLCSAKAAFLAPLMLTGSSFGPMMTKSLYITEWRFTPNPCAMNFSSASLACTKTTSASPRRAVSSALPVPWATTLTTMPVFCLNSGRMWPNRPESCVDVVEATTMDLSCAEASDICARAKAITNERFRILGKPSLSGPVEYSQLSRSNSIRSPRWNHAQLYPIREGQSEATVSRCPSKAEKPDLSIRCALYLRKRTWIGATGKEHHQHLPGNYKCPNF